ncbi:MAG: Spheroidene monooxygenase, partial [Bacteroidota bacterium]
MTALGTHISVRFMTFSGWRARWRAFGAMGISLRQGVAAPGLCFGKMLGSGAGQGFSIWPDWGTYAWFTVWENPESAEAFWSNDPMFQDLLGYATSVYGWEARPLRGHGTWNGQQPFAFPEAGVRTAGSVAVLTRASIARKQALRFWWNVPRASRGVQDQPGLRYAKGVGEYPLVEQATMSVWNSADELDAFAYRSRQHAPMVQKT